MENEQKKLYLFGAGINCIGVIHYFGKSNIIAIIDSDKRLQGSFVYGIPVISLQDYLSENRKGTIIITGFFCRNEIAETLQMHGITNYYISPYMTYGYYDSGQDIAEKLDLYRFSKIGFYGSNPLADTIVAAMREKGYLGSFSFADTEKFEKEETLLVITNTDDRERWEREKRSDKQIIDINETYKQKYAFHNPQLCKFKNIHKSKRCFVIGNGPSLRYEDLEKLHRNGEICFGVNRIYLAYGYTAWRPDYYVATDYFIIEKDADKIQDLPCDKFVKHLYKTDWFGKKDNLYEYGGLMKEGEEPQFSGDIVKGIYSGKTVVYDAIQIAAYMGFSEIYLLGVDMTLTKTLNPEEEGAHFYKSPDTNEKLMKGNRSENLRAMKAARKYLETEGRTIKNCTRNAQWDELEKVDFDSLM